jgi:adenosylcobinamide-GDP ribazoletransferase
MPDVSDRLRRLPDDTVVALAFFSRFPVAPRGAVFDLRQAAAGWPIAGFIIALWPALLFLLMWAADFSGWIAALFAFALYAGLTGAIHEDGLADTFDGFGGGRTAAEKLAIMDDSRLGTYGALALMFALLIKIVAVTDLASAPGRAVLALLGAATLSRSIALWHWNERMPAKREGAAWAAGRPDWLALAIGVGIGAIAALAFLIGFGIAGLIAVLLGAAGVGVFSSLAKRQIGGYTGDTIGAAQQIAEALILAGLSMGWPTVTTIIL